LEDQIKRFLKCAAEVKIKGGKKVDEDVSSHWMTSRNREDTRIIKEKH